MNCLIDCVCVWCECGVCGSRVTNRKRNRIDVNHEMVREEEKECDAENKSKAS